MRKVKMFTPIHKIRQRSHEIFSGSEPETIILTDTAARITERQFQEMSDVLKSCEYD